MQESRTKVAPRDHRFHVRVDDHVLDPFRLLHHSIRRLVGQQCHDVRRQQQLSLLRSPRGGGYQYQSLGVSLAVDHIRHSSHQCQCYAVQSIVINKHPS
jgi:hypothetical protein